MLVQLVRLELPSRRNPAEVHGHETNTLAPLVTMSRAMSGRVLKIGPGDIAATRFAPSADAATALQYSEGALFVVQIPPPFVEVKIGPPYATTASFVPSADDAIELHGPGGIETGVHVSPPLVERKIGPTPDVPPPTATSLVPSAEEATPTQLVCGALVSRQVTPEFVEVQTGPLATLATIFDPSADEAIESQKSVAERAVQVIPELGQVWGRPP